MPERREPARRLHQTKGTDLLDRLTNTLHLLLAVACVWLIASSPWLAMFGRIPPSAGFIDLSHVVVGLAVLPLVVVYAIACLHGGRWRLYFPWAAGAFAPVARDVAGLLRGQRPMSEGGGLFATIEGLLLVALLATAATGVLWFALTGTPEAFGWRTVHLWAARSTAVLLLLHVVAVSLHLVDLLRG